MKKIIFACLVAGFFVWQPVAVIGAEGEDVESLCHEYAKQDGVEEKDVAQYVIECVKYMNSPEEETTESDETTQEDDGTKSE